METRNQGRWNENMMTDHYWSIKRVILEAMYKKIHLIGNFWKNANDIIQNNRCLTFVINI